MEAAVGVHDARHLADARLARAVLKLLLHVSGVEGAEVAALREGAAVAALLRVLGEDVLRRAEAG